MSGIPLYVPWYFLAFDTAMLTGAVALFQAQWPMKLFGKLGAVFAVFMPYFVLLQYGARLVNHLLARVQWFLSTMEYREIGRAHV